MASLHIEQLKALFIKDWLIRRRHWIATLFELFLPLLLTMILLKSLVSTGNRNSTQENDFSRQTSTKPSNPPSESNFVCYLVGDIAYYTPATADIVSFMNNVSNACDITVTPYSDENSILEALDSPYIGPTGVVFHTFDAEKRKANYSILKTSLQYDGPWNNQYQFISDLFSLQAAINLLLSSYPKIDTSTLEFTYTKELLPEKPSQLPPKSDITKLNKISFFLTYFFLEICFLFLVD